MIWFLTSFTSYYFQKFLYVVKVLNDVYHKEREMQAKTSVHFASSDDIVEQDELDGRGAWFQKARNRGRLERKMSFAGGVDGTGQSIAILTSGGDSQG